MHGRPTHRLKESIKVGLQDSGMRQHGLHSSGLVHRKLVSSCEHSNEPADCIKCGKYDLMRNYYILKKDSAPHCSLKPNKDFIRTAIHYCVKFISRQKGLIL
jgi:hypothetical protein